MKYINFGEVTLSNNPSNSYIVNKFDMNTLSTEFQEDKPLESDGSIISNITYDMRICTITGNICADNDANLEIARKNLLQYCDGKTMRDFVYTDNEDTYQTTAFADVPILGQKEGYTYTFQVNFNIPSVYFYKVVDEVVTNEKVVFV